ncbi:MAG: hypothetical protein Q4B48_02415, partial [Syntrophomonadaceae bacterium]|nr:hypothetical protein [Syntrophomonadaceae bacterium]
GGHDTAALEKHFVRRNYIMYIAFAYSTVVLALVLLLLYPTRRQVQKLRPKAGSALATTYKYLRKTHQALGVLVIPVAFCHCRIAANTTGERSTLGASLLILLILLGLSRLLKKPLGRHWKRLHQVLAAMLMTIGVCHGFIGIVM